MRDDRTPEALAWAWHDALLARDPVAFAGLFAPDGVMIDVEHRTEDLSAARPLRGPEEIASMARAWFAATPVFDYRIRAVLADGHAAAKRWRYTVPGTAGAMVVDGVTWLSCADGAIREALVLFDSHALLRGLGRL
jgi:uncharacterized protein (TIGR02246 family)